MFAKPRPKKSILPPPNKKRRTTSAVEEISFDHDAREEYLSGFHKRKQQRIKRAQEEAAKNARLEKIEARKQLREERRRDVEAHVETVNKILREAGAIANIDDKFSDDDDEASDEWGGIQDRPDLEMLDHEEEYIDEDRYTTVTVESVMVSRDGLGKHETKEAQVDGEKTTGDEESAGKETKPMRPKKQRKKKFRYETKLERKETDKKQKARHRSKRPDK